MSDHDNTTPYLDINELNAVDAPSPRSRHIETFKLILKQCHNKIKNYNQMHRKKFCFFTPPLYVMGRPAFNYIDLLQYLMTELQQNGLMVQLTQDNGLFICWDKRVLDPSVGQPYPSEPLAPVPKAQPAKVKKVQAKPAPKVSPKPVKVEKINVNPFQVLALGDDEIPINISD